MGISCSVLGRGPRPATQADLDALAAATAQQLAGLDWGCEAFTFEGALEDGSVQVFTKVHNEDSERIWKDLMQCLALTVVASRVQPDWVWRFEDDLDLLGVEVGQVWLRGGVAGGSSEMDPLGAFVEDADLDARMRKVLALALGGSLGSYGIDAPQGEVAPLTSTGIALRDEPEPEAVLRLPGPDQQPHPGYTNRPAVVGCELRLFGPDDDGDRLMEGTFELLNGQDPAQEVRLVAVVRDAQGRALCVLDASAENLESEEYRQLESREYGVSASPPASVEHRVEWLRHERVPVEARRLSLLWSEPDSDGDRRFEFVVGLQNTGTATVRTLLQVSWLDGEALVHHEEISGDPAGHGHYLLRFSHYQYSYDELDRRSLTPSAVLVLVRSEGFDGDTLAGPTEPPPGLPEQAPPGPVDEAAGPWELIAAGRVDAALSLLSELDSDGRDRVRALLQSTDPVMVVAGLRVSRQTWWRSAVTTMRRLFHHDDARVRMEAARGVGEMGGPSLVVPLRALLADPVPEVREAAMIALEKLGG